MRDKARWAILAGTALAAMAAAAVGPAAAETTEVGTPREQTLIVDMLDGVLADPQAMNPFFANALLNEGINNLIYSPLWDVNTATGKMNSMIAAELPEALDKSFTKFRIKLRPNLTWSDGVKFTADDVIFTAKMLADHKELTARGMTPEVVKSMTKVDDYTIDVETNKPEPRFVSLIGSIIYGSGFRIVPEHIWKDKDPSKFKNYPPIALGPYTLEKEDPNGSWILWKRREDWQHSDVGAAIGKPNPQYVLFRYYGPEEKRVLAMAQNKIDILMDISADSFQNLRSINPHVHAWSENFPYGNFNDPCARGIHFNTTKPPYDKWQTRWALALATDAVDVSMNSYGGMLRFSALQAPPIDVISKAYYEPLASGWLQTFALPDGYKPFDGSAAEKVAARLKAQNVENLPSTPEAIKAAFGVGWWKYDTAEAAKLLESVGFKKGSDGKWLQPDGKLWKISMDAPSDFEVESRRIALATAESWRKFGVDVDVNLMQSAAFGNHYHSGQFTVASQWWPLSCAVIPDLFSNLERFHKDYVAPPGSPSPNNPERFSTPEISALIDQLRKLPSDDPAIVPTWTKVLEHITEQLPIINIVGTTKFVPTNDTYWTNYPSASNYYEGPWWWWSEFKEMLPKIKPAKS